MTFPNVADSNLLSIYIMAPSQEFSDLILAEVKDRWASFDYR
jgi:hypothetical protein